MKFTVKRRHMGDRMYERGDEREADEREVAHLVANGVLEPVREKVGAKAERAPQNKAMAAPENKAK